MARNRFPPASSRWVDASASSSSSDRVASASCCLDQGEPVNDLRGQRGVGQLHRDGGDQSGSRSSVIAAVTDRVGLA